MRTKRGVKGVARLGGHHHEPVANQLDADVADDEQARPVSERVRDRDRPEEAGEHAHE
jgi:hypothetical protein